MDAAFSWIHCNRRKEQKHSCSDFLRVSGVLHLVLCMAGQDASVCSFPNQHRLRQTTVPRAPRNWPGYPTTISILRRKYTVLRATQTERSQPHCHINARVTVPSSELITSTPFL